MEGKKKLILAAAAVVVAIAIGLGMYNSPANQLSRQLNLGQKYLEEENYEQAVVAFLKAIEIDDKCMEAYLGCITAYTESGESEELAAIYDSALEAVGGLGEAEAQENSVQIEKLQTSLEDYLKKLIEEKQYTQAKEEIEKYEEKAPSLTFKDLYAKAEEEEKLETEYQEILEEISGYITEKSYGEGIPWSYYYFYFEDEDAQKTQEIQTSWAAMADRSYRYLPGDPTGQNGVGTGIYRFAFENIYNSYEDEDEEAIIRDVYAFYYGDYVNGERSGNGIWLFVYMWNVYVFEGEWVGDSPNGYGEIQRWYDGEEATHIYRGNLSDGLWDGIVEIESTFGGKTISYEASQGYALEDKKEEYYAQFREEGFEITEGEYRASGLASIGGGTALSGGEKCGIAAYDGNFAESIPYGKTAGVFGFADSGYGEQYDF